MIVNSELSFWESYLPSPRHRKVRLREVKRNFSATVVETAGSEAPVAIRMKRRSRWDGPSDYGTSKVLEYRWHNNRLFVPVRLSRFRRLNGERQRMATSKDLHYCGSYHFGESSDEAQRRFDEWAASWLLVDGRLHEEIGEPRYVIMTFGLGCNHGIGWGTSLSVDHWYNSNIHRDRYFRIDQEEEARKAGREIAERRGDTNAFPHFDRRLYERFTILKPEAIHLNPKKEHGTGCDFINKVESLVEAAKNPTLAGFGAIALALR